VIDHKKVGHVFILLLFRGGWTGTDRGVRDIFVDTMIILGLLQPVVPMTCWTFR